MKKMLFILLLSALAYSQGKLSIAVMELDGKGVSETDLAGLSDQLRTELFQTGKYDVIERSRMNEILVEQGFQQSGCTNTECAVEIGQMIGVRKIVVGSINKVGTIYTASIRMVDVGTAKIDKIASEHCEDCSINNVLLVTVHDIILNIGDGVKYYIIKMPRKARIDYPGLTHHIMARTFTDLLLFRDDEDKEHYVSLLSHRIKESGFLCFAWVLMDTHIHLLIKTNEKPLWHLMKPLNSDYSRWYNKKYIRRGPLFIDRYKSIATQDQYYLEQLVCYIHLNPIRAGICKDLNHLKMYPWSGHSAIMGIHSNNFQEVKAVLKRFGKTRKKALGSYEMYLKEALNGECENYLLEIIRSSNKGRKDKSSPECWVIGDHEFQCSVVQKDTANRLTLSTYKKQGLELDDLLKKVSQKMEVPEELILLSSKRTRQVDARMVFCCFAGVLGFPTRETGAFLGIQQAAVSNAGRKGSRIVKERDIKIV